MENHFNHNATFTRMSSLYAPTLKEDPGDADLASHRLLLRAGFIRKTAAGLYSYLPLGWRSLLKIEKIVREEMNASGAQEILMPILGPAELWEESGRLSNYGAELMRISDRHDRDFVLGPTHEEIITDLVRNELRSYKALPINLYQISDKFRDELRPRFGLMRGREFIMKDAYSFDVDVEGMKASFEVMFNVYAAINRRAGLNALPVAADSGQIGGANSIEFMALAETGEADIIYCPSCGYAADIEAATVMIEVGPGPKTQNDEMEELSTPGVKSIKDLAKFIDGEEKDCRKAIALVQEVPEPSEKPSSDTSDKTTPAINGKPVVVILPGDHELNDIKAQNAFGNYHLMDDEELKHYGLVQGFIGPVGLPEDVELVADISLKDSFNWLIGANKPDTHYFGAQPGRDFEVSAWIDLAEAKPGDICPDCGKPLAEERGVEVGQIFQLGDKYSKALNACFLDKDGKEKPFQMGCYGIGITRTLAAIVEQHHDDAGICWPISVAPFEVHVLALDPKQDEVAKTSTSIARELGEQGIEVLLDDRDERPGVKFNEADLMGVPVQVIVGKRGLERGIVEIKQRETQEKQEISVKDSTKFILDLVEELKNR